MPGAVEFCLVSLFSKFEIFSTAHVIYDICSYVHVICVPSVKFGQQWQKHVSLFRISTHGSP